MAWVEQDLIYQTNASYGWSQTHTQVPSALALDDCIRIYYATRDHNGFSRTSFIDVAHDDPGKILYVHDKPVMELGKPGTHDEDGVMVGCVLQHGNEIRMYYTGWSRGVHVPYYVSSGLAISTDGGKNFTRAFEGPVVDRTQEEPYMTMSPYVMRDAERWHMWYGSGTGWTEVEGKMEPLYIIKYAHSTDGLHWAQENITSIAPLHPLEANTRPSVLRTANGFEMWFSYRHSIGYREGGGGYRIGRATSPDGKTWQRQSDVDGIGVRENSWCSQMCAYPSVIEVNGRRIMFYNGDGFGQSGFGYAVWES